jgi:hypothetical protein
MNDIRYMLFELMAYAVNKNAAFSPALYERYEKALEKVFTELSAAQKVGNRKRIAYCKRAVKNIFYDVSRYTPIRVNLQHSKAFLAIEAL